MLRASQILRGKLRRIHKALNRDAFDLITAANTFPRHGNPRTLKIIGSPDTATRKSGMQDYLDNNTTVSSCEITQALHKAATNTGTTLVLDTADDDPAERVRGLLRENDKKPT